MSDEPTILMGFDFVGAGNVGDDLMVEGFRRLAPTPAIVARSGHDVESQQGRFPEIAWVGADEMVPDSCDPPALWAGVGGTPFQHSVGSWMLDWLEAHRGEIEAAPRRVLVGVGAEAELAGQAPRFAAIAGLFDRIATRDRHSTRVVTETLGVDADRVFTGADLAHVAMAALADACTVTPAFDVGLVPVADRGEPGVAAAIASAVGSIDGTVALLANDVRDLPGLESAIAREVAAIMGEAAPSLLTPGYGAGTLEDLIAPTALCASVISWRYHALLAGAWLGRRVAAVGRSSKVVALARDLGVAWREAPVSAADLVELAEEAHPVPRERLGALRERAEAGARWALAPEHEARPAERSLTGAVRPIGPRLADLGELRSAPFRALMARLNRFAGARGLRRFDTWSKIWEYPWLWFHALASVDWPGTHVVDIGAEMSPLPWLLGTLGARLTLIETDGQFVELWERLRDELGVEAAWHVVSDEALPVETGAADVVTSLSVIEHQPDKRRAIDEVARVLRPGGVFTLSFDICEPGMGMTFPEWNGRALTMREFDEVVRSHPAFEAPGEAWNTDAIPAFLEWHRTTAPHHNYVTGAAVLVRRA